MLVLHEFRNGTIQVVRYLDTEIITHDEAVIPFSLIRHWRHLHLDSSIWQPDAFIQSSNNDTVNLRHIAEVHGE